MSLSERDQAIRLANSILERPNADPDDTLAILSRQFLRALRYDSRVPLPIDNDGPAIEGRDIAVIKSISPMQIINEEKE